MGRTWRLIGQYL